MDKGKEDDKTTSPRNESKTKYKPEIMQGIMKQKPETHGGEDKSSNTHASDQQIEHR